MRKKFPLLHETTLSQSFETKGGAIVNEDAYAALLNYLSNEGISKAAQPHLIVGEAGCGKTFLLKRLANGIQKDCSLSPVVMEGKALFATKDIWGQCASQLKIGSAADGFDDILTWQEQNARRVVLFIDNIQYYFARTGNTAHFQLRGKLNRPGAPILIATSEKVLPAFTDYNAAFFDGFRIIYLKQLTLSEGIDAVLKGKADMNRLGIIMEFMPKTIRSMLIAADLMERSQSAATDLDMLADYFHPYYQAKYDASPMQVQRILSALASADGGISLLEIRGITGQENGKISPYLKLMADHSLIKKEAKTQRGGIYSIADPLFRLWLQRTI